MGNLCADVEGVMYPTVFGREDETGFWYKEPGSWRWIMDGPLGERVLEAVLPVEYPDLPGRVRKYLSFRGQVNQGDHNGLDIWGWDGDEDKPTLSGSILVNTSFGPERIRLRWHGYMVKGNFEGCE